MKLLAFDTSTQTLSIAVGEGVNAPLAQYQGEGGARASRALIASAQQLLAQAGWRLQDLDAIAFGAGPGSFTGLRTACAVAQGLALGLDCPLLPVPTLLAVAEDARARHAAGAVQWSVAVLLDARMHEVYASAWDYAQGAWQERAPVRLCAPAQWAPPAGVADLAGNAHTVYAQDLAPWLAPAAAPGLRAHDAAPDACAMLRLAPQLWAQGRAVAPEDALPVYVRDKVAQTSAERAALKASAAAAP
ncbi:MAG: tRNA (adenosine(37)-N6)-threonylcarbamoyltransferase complex dimerization subunit type 1 TsaB [Rhodoferax sp.]